jgi:hypothetical protein
MVNAGKRVTTASMVGGECEKMNVVLIVLIDFASLFRGGQGESRDAPLSSQPVPMWMPVSDGTSDARLLESKKDVRSRSRHAVVKSF